jgi:hypothetical protein
MATRTRKKKTRLTRRKAAPGSAKRGPKPINGKTSLTAFRLPAAVLQRLDVEAAAAGSSRTKVVSDVLMQHFQITVEPEGISAFD